MRYAAKRLSFVPGRYNNPFTTIAPRMHDRDLLRELVKRVPMLTIRGRAKTDAEHYASERAREERETTELPEVEAEEVAQIFRDHGLPEETVGPVVAAIRSDQKRWVDFMMKFELGLEPPEPNRARRSALVRARCCVRSIMCLGQGLTSAFSWFPNRVV
jgi:hypothetical protein